MLKYIYYNMGLEDILVKTYELFLALEIIKEESDIDKELERLLVERDYETMAKTLLYILIYTLNDEYVYRAVRRIYINKAIDLLYMIDRIGFDNEAIIKKFVQLLYAFSSYSIEHKIKFITDIEKREIVRAKLDELVNLL